MQSNRVKEVLNKMDYNLKEIFETVEINRLDNQRELTFEVKLKGFKAKPSNKAELLMYMTETAIFENSMIWRYKTNPLDENSMYVTRTSTLNSMSMDVEQIINENRFATEYLDTLLVSMNESMDKDIDSVYRLEQLAGGDWIVVDNHGTEVAREKNRIDALDIKRELFYSLSNKDNESGEYTGEDSPIRVKVTGKYAVDHAEAVINILDDSYGIGASFVDVDGDSVILDVIPYSSYKGTREDFENFVNDNEYFYKVDDDYDFDADEEVLYEGVEAIIIDRDMLVVESVKYNVYQVYVDGIEKSIFEYDLKKK